MGINIDKDSIILKDYFDELELMNNQYGQEEELYPLVNMIIRENCKLNGLSLRDVHNKASKGLMRSLLVGYVGFADLVILDKEYKPDDLKVYNDYVNNMNDYNDFIDCVKYMYGCVEIKTHLSFTAFDENSSNVTINKKYFEKQKNEKEKNRHQVMGELLWYGKVLYTDGYIWQYIELDKIETDKYFNRLDVPKFRVESKTRYKDKGYTIGDNYEVELPYKVKTICELKNSDASSEFNKNEWNRLKNNLSAIDWTSNDNISKFI